jgi:hypothetical protein
MEFSVGAAVIVYFNDHGDATNLFCSDGCSYERTCIDCGAKKGVEDEWETLDGISLCAPCVDRRFRERQHHPPEWD